MALGIASRCNLRDLQFWCHYSLAWLFSEEGRFRDAHAHIEYSKSHAVNDAYILGCGMRLQADILLKQGIFEEAKSKVLCAVETFEKFGAARDLEVCKELLQWIEEGMNNPVATHESDSDSELLDTVLFLTLAINSPFLGLDPK